MSLKKYLAKLAAKGPAQEKLSDEIGQAMRLKILSRFENMAPEMMGSGKPATEMRLAMNWPEHPAIGRSSHPDVSNAQYLAAMDQLVAKSGKTEDFGKWTAMGQPTTNDVAKHYEGLKKEKFKQWDKRRPIEEAINELKSMDYDIPRSLEAKAQKMNSAENRVFRKEEEARNLWLWMKQKDLGKESREVKIGDHKAGIKKWSLENWIKKNQGDKIE